MRYGILKNGVNDIKCHIWFNGVDWMKILNREIAPPFVPQIKNPGDASNFDTFEEEEYMYSSTNRYSKEFEKLCTKHISRDNLLHPTVHSKME